MKSNREKLPICANLLLFDKEWKAGAQQSQLLTEAANLDFQTVELRQEYFRSPKDEIPQIVELAEKYKLSLYLSVPDMLFLPDGRLNPKLPSYLAKAQELNAKRIKFNIGNYKSFTGDLSETLMTLCTHNVQISVENDQSQANGTIQPIRAFMTSLREQHIPIDFTFDIGNWLATGEDPFNAAVALADYTAYIHIKDMKKDDSGNFIAVAPDTGQLSWRKILQQLPKHVPVALEYPVENRSLILKDLSLIGSTLSQEVDQWPNSSQ
jgi:sugar phosphate isomerase/epimerase